MTLWWWVAQHLVVTAALAMFAVVAGYFLRRRPALQHALWAVVLIKFVAPPLVVWPCAVGEIMADQAAPSGLPRDALRQASGAETTLTPADGTQGSRHKLATGAVISEFPPPRADNAEPHAQTPLMAEEPTNAESAPNFEGPEQFVLAGSSVESNPARQAKGKLIPSEAPVASNTVMSASVGPAVHRGQLADLAFYGNLTLFSVWIAGSVTTLLRLGRQIAAHRRIVVGARPAAQPLVAAVADLGQRMGTRTIPVFVADDVASPFVWCLGRLKMIWPARLANAADLPCWQGVIAHELAHVRRRDHWVSWIELLAGIVWWWNPLFWFARRRLREAAEMACDAMAVNLLPAGRRAYAEALLELSLPLDSGGLAPVLGAGTRDRCSFERRLSMILTPRVHGSTSKLGFAGATLLAAVALPGWSLLQADQPETTAAGEQPPPSAAIENSESALPPAAEKPVISTVNAAQPADAAPVEQSPKVEVDVNTELSSPAPVSKLTMQVHSQAVWRQPKQKVTRVDFDDGSLVSIGVVAEEEVHIEANDKTGGTQLRLFNGEERVGTVDLLVVSRLEGELPPPPTPPVDRNRIVGAPADEVRIAVQSREGLMKQRGDIERQLKELNGQYAEVLALTLGLRIVPLTAEERSDLKLAGGIKIREVMAGLAGEKAKLQAGDIILGVGKFSTREFKDLAYALERVQAGKTVFLVHRDGVTRTAPVETNSVESPSVPTMLTLDQIQPLQPVSPTAPAQPTPLPNPPSVPPAANLRPSVPSAYIPPIYSTPPGQPAPVDPVVIATAPAALGPAANVSQQLDVTNLGIALIDAQADVEMAQMELAITQEMSQKNKLGDTSELRLRQGIELQSAKRKLTWLTKIAQITYDEAVGEFEHERERCQQVEKLAANRATTAAALQQARRKLSAAESRLKMLETVPGIEIKKRPETNRTIYEESNIGSGFSYYVGVRR